MFRDADDQYMRYHLLWQELNMYTNLRHVKWKGQMNEMGLTKLQGKMCIVLHGLISIFLV